MTTTTTTCVITRPGRVQRRTPARFVRSKFGNIADDGCARHMRPIAEIERWTDGAATQEVAQ